MQLALSDFELFQNQQLPGKNLHTALNDEDDNDDEADRSGKSYFWTVSNSSTTGARKSCTTVSEEKWKFSCTTKCQFWEGGKWSEELFTFLLFFNLISLVAAK